MCGSKEAGEATPFVFDHPLTAANLSPCNFSFIAFGLGMR